MERKKDNVALIQAEIGCGARNWGSRTGPNYLIKNGLLDILQKTSLVIRQIEKISSDIPLQASKDKDRRYFQIVKKFSQDLKNKILQSLSLDQFPFILGGDHSVVVGAFAALSEFYKDIDIALIYI